MTLCKYGCGEEITWIDGRPYSLQSHFKVCRPAGKKPGKRPPEIELAVEALVSLGHKQKEAERMVAEPEPHEAALVKSTIAAHRR